MAKAAGMTAEKVRTATKPGRYGDNGGLYLVVQKSGTKNWVYRGTIEGRQTDRGLGGYPDISLQEARKLAAQYKAGVKVERSKPVAVAEIVTTIAGGIPTFRAAMHSEAERKAGALRETTRRSWFARLERHVVPMIGERRIDTITRMEVANLLSPIHKEKHQTATDVRQSMSQVFEWAVAAGFRTDNPADKITLRLLPEVSTETEHHAALPYADIPGFLEAVKRDTANASTKLALEFLILTGARSEEVRGMTWAEVDGDVWTVPAGRYKTAVTHRVPLSRQAQEVLGQVANDGGLVFKSEKTGGALGDNTFHYVYKRLGVNTTSHGFRSSLRMWIAEQTDASYEAGELALGHAVGNPVTRAYLRTDLLEVRRSIMEQWGAFLRP